MVQQPGTAIKRQLWGHWIAFNLAYNINATLKKIYIQILEVREIFCKNLHIKTYEYENLDTHSGLTSYILNKKSPASPKSDKILG